MLSDAGALAPQLICMQSGRGYGACLQNWRRALTARSMLRKKQSTAYVKQKKFEKPSFAPPWLCHSQQNLARLKHTALPSTEPTVPDIRTKILCIPGLQAEGFHHPIDFVPDDLNKMHRFHSTCLSEHNMYKCVCLKVSACCEPCKSTPS